MLYSICLDRESRLNHHMGTILEYEMTAKGASLLLHRCQTLGGNE